MMKRFSLVLTASLLMFAGCSTIRTSHVFNDVEVDGGRIPLAAVEIENTGWFLFDVIPLICGDPSVPNGWGWRCFTNTVTLQSNLEMLDKKMQLEGANEVANLTSRSTDDFYYFFILYRRSYHTSAVLLREKDQK